MLHKTEWDSVSDIKSVWITNSAKPYIYPFIEKSFFSEIPKFFLKFNAFIKISRKNIWWKKTGNNDSKMYCQMGFQKQTLLLNIYFKQINIYFYRRGLPVYRRKVDWTLWHWIHLLLTLFCKSLLKVISSEMNQSVMKLFFINLNDS